MPFLRSHQSLSPPVDIHCYMMALQKELRVLSFKLLTAPQKHLDSVMIVVLFFLLRDHPV